MLRQLLRSLTIFWHSTQASRSFQCQSNANLAFQQKLGCSLELTLSLSESLIVAGKASPRKRLFQLRQVACFRREPIPRLAGERRRLVCCWIVRSAD